jgi:hypothetical protein
LNITGDVRGAFNPTQLAANASATGSEAIAGSADDGEVSNTVTVVFGQGESGAASATVTVPACLGTPAPEGIAFSFTNDPSAPQVQVGDTVDYFYCGVNESGVELEVVRVVDDRFGALEVPESATVVSPGERLCNTDLGLPVTYQTVDSDAGTKIVNNAVVTVRTADGQEFQAADPAEVEVLGFGVVTTTPGPTTTMTPAPIPVTGARGLPAQLLLAAFGIAAGSALLIVTSRRRRTN